MYLNVKEGQILSVVGSNGSGKTSLFKILIGEYTATEGRILLNGAPLSKKRIREVCYCPQFNSLIEEISVERNFEFFARAKGFEEEAIPSLTADWLQKFNLS